MTDPYVSNVSLLLHLNGSNNDTSFIDETGKTITPYGNVKISTSESKFGNSSAFFDGNGDYLSLYPSSDWNFGTRRFYY